MTFIPVPSINERKRIPKRAIEKKSMAKKDTTIQKLLQKRGRDCSDPIKLALPQLSCYGIQLTRQSLMLN